MSLLRRADIRHAPKARVQSEAPVEILTTEAQWEAIESEWKELLSSVESPSPNLLWEVAYACRAQYRDRLRHMTVVVRHFGKTIAIFPLCLLSETRWFEPKRLFLLGMNPSFGGQDFIDEPLHLIRPGFEDLAISQLLAALTKAKKDLVDINLYLPSGTVAAGLKSRNRPGPSVVDLPETWDQYRKMLTKSMRDNLPYYPRLLQRAGHSHEVIFADDLAEDLVRLHKKRNESRLDPKRVDHFATPDEQALQEKVWSRLAEEGKGYYAALVVDGALVAVQAFAELDQTLLIGYSGFDPEWRSFSPLLILQSEVFKSAMVRGVRRLNFQRGCRAWQTRWKAEPMGVIHSTTIVSKNPISIAKCLIQFAGREVEAAFKKVMVKVKASRFVNQLSLMVGPDLTLVSHRAAHLGVRAMQMGLHHPAARLLRLH